MNLKIFIVTALAVLIFMTGCHKPAAKQYDRQLPPGALALRKITNPADIPDFTPGSYTAPGIQKAIDNSLNYLSKPSSKQFFPYGEITHQHAVESLKVFSEDAQKTAAGARQVVAKVDATVDTTHQYIDDIGRKLLASTDQLSKLLDNLNSVSRDAAEGQGTVGMMLRDPHLYDELMLTIQRMGDAAAEMKVLIKQWEKQGLLSAAK